MRLFLFATAACLLLSIACAQEQQSSGLLGSLKSFFRPRRQNRPQNGQPPQNFQPQQGQQQQPQQQQFNQQPSNSQQQGAFRQQQHQQPQHQQPHQQQQRQKQRPQQQTNFKTRQPQQNKNNPSFRVVNNAQSSNNPFPQAGDRTCKALPFEDPNDREFPRCPDTKANHFDEDGKGYILTFQMKNPANPAEQNENCVKFTGYQADNYCKAQGGRAVSLDSNKKSEHFLDVSAQFAQRYYWTGGRMNHPCKTLYWPSGRSEGWESGKRYWSHTGGSKAKIPQPDNRNYDQDGLEDEICLAVLNNFYKDNIKWHDVACHHKKPTICELDH